MTNEKPGGHGERSVAVGVIDMAVWDAVAKIAGKPLYRLLAERFGSEQPHEKVFVYAAGGYYYPGKGLAELQREMQRYLDAGYTVVKMKIGAVSLAEDMRRIEAVLKLLDAARPCKDRPAVTWPSTPTVALILKPPWHMPGSWSRWGFSGMKKPAILLDYRLQGELACRYREPLATGENLFSHQDTANLLRYGGMRPARTTFRWTRLSPTA